MDKKTDRRDEREEEDDSWLWFCIGWMFFWASW